MDSLIFYWVVTLVILIILIMITDIGTASIITSFIMVIKLLTQEYNSKLSNEKKDSRSPSRFMDNIDPFSGTGPETSNTIPSSGQMLSKDVIVHNATMLEDVLHPRQYSADDKIFDASIVSGYKSKKAKEIRSHMNNNNWKRYYDKELGEQETRHWWGQDERELAQKHVLV